MHYWRYPQWLQRLQYQQKLLQLLTLLLLPLSQCPEYQDCFCCKGRCNTSRDCFRRCCIGSDASGDCFSCQPCSYCFCRNTRGGCIGRDSRRCICIVRRSIGTNNCFILLTASVAMILDTLRTYHLLLHSSLSTSSTFALSLSTSSKNSRRTSPPPPRVESCC